MSVIGGSKISKEALKVMKLKPEGWFAYKNLDLGKYEIGALRYMRCGENCRYANPPEKMPEAITDTIEKFMLVGEVDVEKGVIKEIIKGEEK